jgi:hypothetical protein
MNYDIKVLLITGYGNFVLLIVMTKNYWGFGLCPSSCVLKTLEHVLVTGSVSILVQCLILALFKGPSRVGVSPSPENGNRSSFQNVVFSSF